MAAFRKRKKKLTTLNTHTHFKDPFNLRNAGRWKKLCLRIKRMQNYCYSLGTLAVSSLPQSTVNSD